MRKRLTRIRLLRRSHPGEQRCLKPPLCRLTFVVHAERIEDKRVKRRNGDRFRHVGTHPAL
ncbi:MAG: hypothetical protein ACJ8GN_26790 [Longimicrobiaceae bacterium]